MQGYYICEASYFALSLGCKLRSMVMYLVFLDPILLVYPSLDLFGGECKEENIILSNVVSIK